MARSLMHDAFLTRARALPATILWSLVLASVWGGPLGAQSQSREDLASRATSQSQASEAADATGSQGGTADSKLDLTSVAGIQRALERIAALLEEQNRQNESDLLLRRIELLNQRLLPIESSLRQVEAQRRDATAERSRVRILDQAAGQRLEAAATESARNAEQAERVQTALQLVTLSQRLSALDDEEKELRALQEELRQQIHGFEARLDADLQSTPAVSEKPDQADAAEEPDGGPTEEPVN